MLTQQDVKVLNVLDSKDAKLLKRRDRSRIKNKEKRRQNEESSFATARVSHTILVAIEKLPGVNVRTENTFQ